MDAEEEEEESKPVGGGLGKATQQKMGECRHFPGAEQKNVNWKSQAVTTSLNNHRYLCNSKRNYSI